MKNWSIPAGSIFGIQLRIHVGFVFLLLFIWFTDTMTAGVDGAVRGLALVAIVFGSVVAHELGHAILAVRYGLKVRSVVLLPIGGVTLMENPSQPDSNPERELRIAAIGPMINLLLGSRFGRGDRVLLPAVRTCSIGLISSATIWCAASSGQTCFWEPSTCFRLTRWMAAGCCAPGSPSAWIR